MQALILQIPPHAPDTQSPTYFDAVTLRLSRCSTGCKIRVVNGKLISVRSGFMHNTWFLQLSVSA